MFDSHLRSTGTQYTITAALLIVAFIFSPAVLMASRPVGYVSVSFAIACSTALVALAWMNWKKYSDLTIPSIVTKS